MNDLNNLHILITRPASQGRALCDLISARGGHPIHFPTIAFGPPLDQAGFLQSLILLGEQDWLIFISPQAVHASITQIQRLWPHFPDSVKWAAIGGGTAKALEEAGITAVLYPDKEQNSEGLLNLPAFHQVAGKKIAIIRGVGGREWLDKGLAERGAHVLPVIAYERILPKVDVSPCLEQLRQKNIDIIVCTSYESLCNLKTLLGETALPFLREIPVIVISERIKMLAKDLGFSRIWVARNMSERGILDLIAEIRKA